MLFSVFQSLDLAEYNFLFALSFTTPTFDSEVAPSFGTLLATVNVALNMLGEVGHPPNPITFHLVCHFEYRRHIQSLEPRPLPTVAC